MGIAYSSVDLCGVPSVCDVHGKGERKAQVQAVCEQEGNDQMVLHVFFQLEVLFGTQVLVCNLGCVVCGVVVDR